MASNKDLQKEVESLKAALQQVLDNQKNAAAAAPQQQPGQGDALASTVANIAAVHLPTFTSFDTDLWFLQVECQFDINGFTTEETRFKHMMKALSQEAVSRVAGVVREAAVSSQTPYTDVKTAILEAYALDPVEKLKKAWDAQLGEEKPSHFVQQLSRLWPNKRWQEDEAFKALFLMKLPEEVRVSLGGSDATVLQLAKVADKKVPQMAKKTAVSAVAGENDEEVSAVAPRKRFGKYPDWKALQAETGVCANHLRYGAKARCQPPCKMIEKKDSGNGKGQPK